MEWSIKHFDELTTLELFEIYKLRCEVFVVEQTCIYQDIDDFDKVSYHIILKDENDIVAYCRVLPPKCTFEEASIGRVICTRRRQGYGTQVVKKGMDVAKEKFGVNKITLEAQVYASNLYKKLGFVQTSDEFLEDGIPHIQMQADV